MSPALLLAAALVAGTPILFAALGELIAERAGVINLGLEGTMLIGAMAGFVVANLAGSATVGFLAAAGAGALFGLAFAVLTITFRMDQIVTGLAFTILGAGLSAFFGKPYVGRPSQVEVMRPDLGPLAELPFLGPALFRHDLLVYLALAAAVAVALSMRLLRQGLILRALGDGPEVLDALGIGVARLRYAYVVAGAALAAIGGAYLSLVTTPAWIEAMTAGRGWIALALVIFAGWRPLWLIVGTVLFGLVEALRFRMQIGGDPVVNAYFLNMLPYLATILVLVLISGRRLRARMGAPAALGLAYDRERR
jgi:simple sugar transport system permease protein